MAHIDSIQYKPNHDLGCFHCPYSSLCPSAVKGNFGAVLPGADSYMLCQAYDTVKAHENPENSPEKILDGLKERSEHAISLWKSARI